MTRLAVLAVAACMLAAAFSTPASAATFHKCAMTDDYTLVKVKGVSCKRGNAILDRFFNGEADPAGFTCHQKQFEGGATTTCKKGAKRIKHYVAD